MLNIKSIFKDISNLIFFINYMDIFEDIVNFKNIFDFFPS